MNRVHMARRRRRIVKSRHTSRNKEHGPSFCLIFIGITAALILTVKLFFPDQYLAMKNAFSRFAGDDSRFGEVLAAFGRAAGGDEELRDSLMDAYAAVFNPSDDDLSEQRTSAENEHASDVLETKQIEPLDVYLFPEPPENVSFDQRNLGFNYVTPVKGVLSSSFGWRKLTDEEGTRFHYGLDFAAEEGTEIVAFADGEILMTGESSTLGKYIILLHSGEYRTLYAHCSRILVTSGYVSCGEVIAQVGQTGSATGSHLHFELQDGGVYLNPIYYVALG